MFQDIIKKTTVDNADEATQVIKDCINYEPRIGTILKQFAEKVDELDEENQTLVDLLREAKEEIKQLRKEVNEEEEDE